MTLKIVPFDGPIGAEVCGVDLAQLMNNETAEALIDAWNNHVLLLFRNQNLTDGQLIKSANWLGETSEISMPNDRRADDDTQIQLVSNILNNDGTPIGAFGDGEMWFHHDNSFTKAPDKATWLYAVELPSSGGNTLFGSCYEAYKALPKHLLEKISGRRVLQVYDYTVREKPHVKDLEGIPHQWQPAVVKHPETERKALYLDRLMTAAIDGYDESESAELLSKLFPYVERADYEHEWQLGDYVIWDNRCSVHARKEFPEHERRLLKRGKVSGEPLVSAVGFSESDSNKKQSVA